MKLCMLSNFRILKNYGNGTYIPMDSENIQSLSIGGYRFDIDDLSVPFDWTACSGGWDKDKYSFHFETGYGFVNDFELDSCFDEEYDAIGIQRENLSAQFLASVNSIDDFHMNFIHNNEECETGYYEDNGTDKNGLFKLELISVGFEDILTGNVYEVQPEVIKAFNKGEKFASLDAVLSNAKKSCEESNNKESRKEIDTIKE